MSQPTGVPVPGEHPDHDLLADLAAEVLPDDLAYRVQDHVMACDYCAWLLAEAEGIRSLLLQTPAETMPAPVLARLELALSTARQEDPATRPEAGSTRTGSGRVDSDRGQVERPTQAERPSGARRLVRSAPATSATTRITAVSGASAAPGTSRLNRMSQPASTARRQAIQEQRAERPSRLLPALKIAAAIVVVAGVGFTGFTLFGPGSAEEPGTAASAAGTSSGTPVLVQVQSTDTQYTRDELEDQIEALITTSRAAASEPDRALLESEASGAPTDSAEGTAENQAVAPSPGQQMLQSPEALRDCLDAINAGTVQPVAVDLARYDGREAAIIVLPANGGGYEVWAVARDCRPGSDGTLDVVAVQP